jgi:hypothetical protein
VLLIACLIPGWFRLLKHPLGKSREDEVPQAGFILPDLPPDLPSSDREANEHESDSTITVFEDWKVETHSEETQNLGSAQSALNSSISLTVHRARLPNCFQKLQSDSQKRGFDRMPLHRDKSEFY